MRIVTKLDKNWLFRKGDLAPESLRHFPEINRDNWQSVTIPHDWAVSGPFDGWIEPVMQKDAEGRVTFEKGNNTGALPYTGCGVYCCELCFPEEWKEKSIRLEFDGIMSHSSVFVNGEKAGSCVYGYTSFAVDITPYISFGGKKNLIAVKAENPPYLTRWYPGAGIYREVRLVILEKRHFPYQKVLLETLELDVEKKRAVIRGSAEGFEEGELFLKVEKEGRLIAEGGNILTLENIELWDTENPSLYRITLSSATDSLTLPYGFRKVVFDAEEGMFLNGKKCRIKGLCMHHDLGVAGAAFDKNIMRWRLKKIKNIHCNALRMAHNPPDPKLLDLCDEMGFLVMDEAFDAWKLPKTSSDYHREFDACSEFDLRSLIRRDRHHASVILWSIGNEIADEVQPGGALIAKRLVDICHEEDPERPVTCAINHQYAEDQGFLHGFAECLDVIGFNYKPDLYRLLHERFPAKPLLGTETAAVNTSRGVYYFPVVETDAKKPFYSSSYAIEHAGWSSSSESMFLSLKKNPFMLGEFAWCTFDYLGEPFPFRYPARSSAWGLFDLAGLPKDRAYLYAAQWNEKGKTPVLHILPHWEWEEGDEIPVHVFSSCPFVELFLNGKSLGTRKNNGTSRLIWEKVIYEKGILEAVGYDEENRETVRNRRVTPEKDVHLSVKVEKEKREGEKGFYAFMELFMTDINGNVREISCDTFSFSVSGGTLVGVDNGDSCSLLPFKRDMVSLYNGHAMLTILFEEEAGGSVIFENENIKESFSVKGEGDWDEK